MPSPAHLSARRNYELRPGVVRNRAADALHAASAIAFDADLLVSTDDALLHLDGILMIARGRKILCRDTDFALQLL